MQAARRGIIRDALGLAPNVVVLSAAIFAMQFGEELWSRFLPPYLAALGATGVTVGAFGTVKLILDAVYQYPGGVLADRLGRRRALLLFVALAIVGYLVLAIPRWATAFAALFFLMAWTSLALPATFAVIGDSLPSERRPLGFVVQSVIKRVPIVLAPPLGGWLIDRLGVVPGVRAGLLPSVGFALATLYVVRRFYVEAPVRRPAAPTGLVARLRAFDPLLARLLFSDCVVRFGEEMARLFIVLYALEVVGVTAGAFGLLVALQMATAILSYAPLALFSRRVGRRPFVVLTFVFFALFPLAVALSRNVAALAIAFVVGGLREIGEPARKALIVDLAPEEERGASVGAYYLIRGLAVSPASLVGGLLWSVRPSAPLVAAFAVSAAGMLAFTLRTRRWSL